MTTSPDAPFQFVFTHLDAIEAVAEAGRRLDLAEVFGYSNAEALSNEWSNDMMDALGYRFDPTTEFWLPQWFPEWSR